MSDRIGFQKDVLHRVLRLHSLRSKSDNFELLQLAIDDSVIFDLVYDRIMDRLETIVDESGVGCWRNTDNQVMVASSVGLLSWLSFNRAEILIELNSIVESLGGLEIASFLFEEITNGLASELV